MEGTLERALTSILSQIDDRFEVVIVDDGSSDQSVKVIERLQKNHPSLRLIGLPRDPNRKLGFTRNISIQEARGEFVLLHLDCDDITAPYIKEFVNVFHQIEGRMDSDFLLSGRPIQMARRDFLLQHGPYRNIHRGEDRDMWVRLAELKAYIPLEHTSFKTILPKSRQERFYRVIYYTFDHLRNDFRKGLKLGTFLHYEIERPERFTLPTRIVRLILMLPAWVWAKIDGPMPETEIFKDPDDFAAYRVKNGGTFSEVMYRVGGEPDWTNFNAEAREIFDPAY
jgi:glycosyltransferase involved in cell wall biosynthesis